MGRLKRAAGQPMFTYFGPLASLATALDLGIQTVNGNLPLTEVFTTFLLPLFDPKSRGKSNSIYH